MHSGQIVGLLKLVQGAQRQLTTAAAWRAALPLATISHRGRVSFWVALKGRKNPRIRLSLLEYRQGHLHIPLFQDIFWQELERQLKEVCSGCELSGAGVLPRLKALLEVVNYMEHYGIVRDPARPVQPRHSWNTNRRISSWTLFNLTRHSHHHAHDGGHDHHHDHGHTHPPAHAPAGAGRDRLPHSE